jgi:hypothetical protein
MSFRTAKLFLLLGATIGPGKLMIILAAATQDSPPEFVRMNMLQCTPTRTRGFEYDPPGTS